MVPSGDIQLIDPPSSSRLTPLVFTRSEFGGGQILDPPQAETIGTFWLFLRGKRSVFGPFFGPPGQKLSDDPPYFQPDLVRRGGHVKLTSLITKKLGNI